MEFKLLSTETVTALHDAVLNPGELPEMAGNKSLAGALGRTEFRITYGLITDAYDLAAMYAVAISQAYVFNDANKRTTHAALEYILLAHDITISLTANSVGDIIIRVAQGHVDEDELGRWLRQQG